MPRGSLSRQVLILALPMAGEQFLNFLVGLTDTYLAGQISKEATSAVGTASYVGWFFTMVFQLLAVGSAALVARMFGQRRTDTANHAMNQAFVSALALGAALSVAVYAAAPLLAAALRLTPEAATICIAYLRIDALGYVLASVNFIGAAVLRGSGDTRTPMAVMVVVNVINVIVSFGLVYGWFGWTAGVNGIAIGTVVARCAGGLIMAAVLIAGRRGMALRWARLKPDLAMIWRMARIGLPSSIEAIIMWSAHFVFIIIINMTAVGDAATVNYSAHIIAMRAEALTYLPAMAWMTASATMIGQYLGAHRPDDARRAGHIAALQGCALTTLVAVAYFVFADQVYAAMTADAAVRRVGAPAFRLLAFAQPFLAMGIIYVGSLRGAGDTRGPMVLTTITTVLVRIPVAYVGGVVLQGGLIGAWCGMWADNVLRFFLMFARYVHGGWQRIRV